MAKGMKKSANEKLRDKYGLTNVKSEPVTKKQKEVAVTQSATGGRKSSLQGAAIGTSKPTTPKKPAQIKAQDSPLLSAAKRFVSNPVGTVSDAVMKPIDDITERITSPSKKLKQEQNRLTQNQKQANSKQADVGKLLGGMAVKAADDVVSGVAGLGDMTLGTAARAFGWENNPFSQWNKLAQTTQQANREYYSKNTANAGKVVQTVDELGTALVEALPQLAIAYMTAGGSLATEGAGAIAQTTGRLAGTEAAQAASKLPGAIKTARAVANNLKTDPQFWTSFADMSGRYYNDAKQDGADDWTATMYALATGIMNAGIESGGGIQKLPGEMKKTERSLLSLIKSAHEEGTEEPIQGIIERASQNLILGKENPLFSLKDENAVFNPKTAAKEYGTGAAVGFGLGAVPAIRRGIQNSANQPTPDMIAEVVKATPDPARAVQNIQNAQTQQIQQNATQATPAAQYESWVTRANGPELGVASVYFMSNAIEGETDPSSMERFMSREGIPADRLQEAVDQGYVSFDGKKYALTDSGKALVRKMDSEDVFSTDIETKRKQPAVMPQVEQQAQPAQQTTLPGFEQQAQQPQNQNTPATNTVTPESSVPQRNGLPEGQGAMSAQFPYREAPSQTNSLDSSLTPEERQMDGMEITHQVRTDADVDAHAKERFDFDYDGEKQDLFDGDGNWDAVDTALAEMIIANEVIKANQTGDYSEVIRLRRLMAEKNNTNWGQVGHTLARYANTPEAQIADAAEALDGYGLKESKKTKVMGDVQKEAYALANAKRTKNADNIIDFIKRMNAKRRTGGLFTPKRVGNTLVKALESEAQKEGGFDFLCSIADAQLRNFVTDNAPLSPIEAIKSVRYQSMLSKLTTVMRNLVGNGVFDPSEVVSNDIGVFADLFMSLRTGRRTTALASPVAGKTKWRGRLDAMQRAYIETALDADISGAENRFEKSPGRTFKMASRNPLTRFLSTVEKWQSYALNVTDEFQKGGIEAETQRGINSLERRGLLEPGALDGWAEETARERTFQNEGRMANAFLGARNALNELASVQDSRGGSFGLGDAVLPFARVPANVVGQFLNYSPLGLVKGAKQMLGVMAKGSKATAQEQAAAARAFGRGINGTAILTFFAAAAANGLLNVADGGDNDDEKDLAKLRQTEGITGTQFNLSAAQRWLDGESTEWRNDDDLMNIGFLEPINGLMALGSLIWDSAQDDDGVTLRDVTNATAESTLQALSDLPAVSSITNIFYNYRNSTADDTAGKIGETATKFFGDTATSIIPNALSGIAQGMDEGTVRDPYSSEKSGIPGVLENTLNVAKAKIPGEKGRESLPTFLDNFGQERKTTASPFMNWLNSNILPGSITKYQTDRVKTELERLMESGADVSIPNRSAEKKVDTKNGEKKLTYAEKRAYQKAYGGETFKGLNELFQSNAYKSLNDDEKAEAEKNVVSFATAKAKQSVGGKAEDPKWATKSDGTMAQNAVYNAQYKTARNTAKQATGKDSPSDGDVLISLSNRGLDYDTTVKIMAQFMEPNTIKKYETAYADGYDFGLSAAFSGAYYEKSYDFGTTDSGNPKQRGKDNTIAWAQENLGLTRSQAIMLYNYLIKR